QRTEIATLNGKIAALESARAEAESAGKRFDDVTRQRVEDELNRLHATLAQKEYALKEQETANRNLQTQLNSEVGQLRQQLAQEESFVQSTQTEIAQLRAETVAQQERIGELEKARQEAVDDWQRAGVIQSELQSRLQAKTDELSSAQASALESRAELETKITELQNELTQQHSVIDSRTTELTELKSQLPQLHAQVGEQESALRQAANRIQEAEQSGAAHQAELARLHDEYQIKFAQLESELTQARAGLDSSDELRAPLEVKINNLQLELAQKQLLADGRSAEIANLKANLQQSMVQIGDLESARRQIAELSQEREQNRTTRERELANLNQQHQIKFQELEDELGQARQSAMEREQQIDEIAERYRQLSADLQARRQHMEAAGAENSTLHDRIRDLEGQRDDQRIQVQGLDRNRIALEAELASLRQEVQQKSWALAQQQASIENLALAHKGQVQKLEARFTDQQSSDGVREAELQNVQTEARSLQHRIEELEAELGQVKLTETSRAEQIRQENFARIEELNALLSQKNSEIEAHSLAQANLEQSLRREVERLLREIDERNGILQNRNDELVRVKADLDATVERLGQLESAARQAETGANGEVESMRTEFQAQLALLQAELSQKEWTLEERQASASSAEQEYRRQIESLRKQISEKESAERQLERDFVIGENQWTEAQPTKSAGSQQSIDSNGGHPQSTSGDSSDRRWHSMFARKRRWKN
ncbi:MAG TPA: hypothetical protein VNT76_02155, partial [Candidatus Binatus sp.]|nr:hypothetical protein [Candidatus Binatus sp.]